MIDCTSIARIKRSGFEGFVAAQALRNARYEMVSRGAGVYLVLWPTHEVPGFLTRSPGGWFKGRDPTVSPSLLSERWVMRAHLLYAGKAGGTGSRASLRSRIRQYIEFGNGRPIGHWGGRLIWQIERVEDLLFCWKEVTDEEPRAIEAALIQSFQDRYGKMPFANLSR